MASLGHNGLIELIYFADYMDTYPDFLIQRLLQNGIGDLRQLTAQHGSVIKWSPDATELSQPNWFAIAGIWDER